MKDFTKCSVPQWCCLAAVFTLFYCSSVSAQAPGWKWQKPNPDANNIQSGHFVDTLHGWMVGHNGTVIKSDDGGVSWQNIYGVTFKSLYDVFFVTPQTGWVVGGPGVLSKTSNGGSNWQNQNPANATTVYYGVHFANSTTGWVVGSGGTILKTTNAGATWQYQVSGTTAVLSAVYFKDAIKGWAVGSAGRILKTTDGGSTWQSCVSGTSSNLKSVHFENDLNGLAVGEYSTLLHTIDGGTTWEPRVTNSGNSHLGVQFSDVNTAWVIGLNHITLKSTDGGLTWTQQIPSAGNYCRSLQFISPTKGWCFGFNPVLNRTQDGGASWQTFPEFQSTTDYKAIDFIDPFNGWTVGENSTVLKTTNGGALWTQLTTGINASYKAVDFTDAQNGCIIGTQGKIVVTHDGGFTWADHGPGNTVVLNSVSFATMQKGWVSGDTGKVFYTSDGGDTWVPQSSGTLANLKKIQFINENTGWAAGEGGVFLKTTDGGVTWQLMGSSQVWSPTDFQFLDAQTGFLTGDSSGIFKTVNGGASWDLVGFIPLSLVVNALYFSDVQNGWAVSNSGGIFQTKNGGVSWTRQLHKLSNSHYQDVVFANPQTGWIVGTAGVIITTLTNDGLDPDALTSDVTGTLFEKTGTDCNLGSNPMRLQGKLVKATPGPYYGISNDQGEYKVRLPLGQTAVNYTLEALSFGNFAFQSTVVCPTNNPYVVALNPTPSVVGSKNFGHNVPACHLLKVSLNSLRRRYCFKSTTTVTYRNEGIATAPDAYILVEFPQWVRPLSASMAHIAVNESIWRFNLGDVVEGQSGIINIIDSVVCGNTSIVGLSQCTRATAYPEPNCSMTGLWSGAEITTNAKCVQGHSILGVYNNTAFAMSDSVDYWISMDSIEVKYGKIKLAAGDSIKFDVLTQGFTVSMIVRQEVHHPTQWYSSIFIQGCGGGSPSVVGGTNFPVSQLPNSYTQCLQIRNSYDPNDKQAYPTGFTANRVVKPGTEMEYIVRFQNTGSDTAYTVYVVDSLDTNLNPETIQFGAASHPYNISMQTSRQGRTFLRWQFHNINLPDSNTNELRSHGFLQYRISPKTGLALGSQVKNEAGIYFDFNPPVMTNQTLTTFDNIVYTDPSLNNNVHILTPTQTTATLRQLGVKLYPNPVTQSRLTVSFTLKGSISLFDAQGRLVYRKDNLEGTSVLPFSLRSGLYMAQITTEKGSVTEKIIVEK